MGGGYVVFQFLRLLFKPLTYNSFQRQNTLWTTSSKSCLRCISRASSSCTSAFLFFRRDSTRARSLRRSSQHASCAVSFRRFPDDNGDCTCSTPGLGPTLQYEGTHLTYLLHLTPDMQSMLQKNEARKSFFFFFLMKISSRGNPLIREAFPPSWTRGTDPGSTPIVGKIGMRCPAIGYGF